MSDQQFFDALQKFDAIPTTRTFADVAPSIPHAASAANLCATYTTVRPILEGLLPFIRAIPGIGIRVGAAIDALIAGLDVLCPQAGTLTVAAVAATYGVGHERFFEALRTFQVTPGDAAGTVAGAAPSLGDICALYRKIKPILDGVLTFIALIPGFGTAAAAAIRALMAVLDGLCR